MLSPVAGLHSFAWLNNIPLHGHPTACLSIDQLMSTWGPSTFGLLWIMLLWAFRDNVFGCVCVCVCGHTFFISLRFIPKSEIAGHRVTLFLAFWVTVKLLSKLSAPLRSHQQWLCEDSCSPRAHQYSLYLSLDDSQLSGCEVGAHWSLMCVSLRTNNVEHLYMCLSAICLSSLKKCLLKSFFSRLSFYYQVVFSRYSSLKSLVVSMICKYLLLLCGLSFSLYWWNIDEQMF